MDRKPDKLTLRALRKYIIFLKKIFSPEKIILFGSRVRGDHLKDSDFDLIVISDKFRNINFRESNIKF